MPGESTYMSSLFFNKFCFAFDIAILKLPFCSLESVPCQRLVRYKTAMQIIQGWSILVKYSKNGVSNLLWWPSGSRNGLRIEDLSNSWWLSVVARASLKMMGVLLPDWDHLTMVGTFFPWKVHSDPNGKILPLPIFFWKKSGSLGCTTGTASTLIPHSTSYFSCTPVIMIKHITGSPLRAVNRSMVKCLSLEEDCFGGTQPLP